MMTVNIEALLRVERELRERADAVDNPVLSAYLRDLSNKMHAALAEGAAGAVPAPPQEERSRCVHCGGPNAIVCNRCYGMVAYAPFNAPPAAPQGWRPKEKNMNGVELIAAERERQITAEGWTPEHDDAHNMGQLTAAAVCYVFKTGEQHAGIVARGVPRAWPWESKWWKPSDDPIRNLVKAGALIAAEIDRLQRAAPPAALPGDAGK